MCYYPFPELQGVRSLVLSQLAHYFKMWSRLGEIAPHPSTYIHYSSLKVAILSSQLLGISTCKLYIICFCF